jgi:serine protease Do
MDDHFANRASEPDGPDQPPQHEPPQAPDEPLEVLEPRPGTAETPTAPAPPFGGAAPTPGATWAAADESTEPTVPSAAWAPVPPPRPNGNGNGNGRGGIRSAVIGGIAGALIGALAAGGIVAAVDDGGSTRTIVQGANSTAAARPASVIQDPGDIESILEKVGPAVVRINVTIDRGLGGSGQGVGTGFIVGSDGVIVTNAHVVEGADTVQVQLDTGRKVSARVVDSFAESDLAVVKIEGRNLPTVDLGDSDQLQVGDQVVAIGNALGLAGAPTVTSGIVSGLNRVLNEPPTSDNERGVSIANTIQTDAAINPGNSGGPLVDANGRVVGINTAIANPSESNNIGFAIAISSAKPIIDALRNGEEPQIAFLGVETRDVTPDVKNQNDLSVDQGAYVVSVEPNSAADRAGIREGDVITNIDGSTATSSEDVINAVRRNAPGDRIVVTVDRNGDERTVEVELRARANT